MEFTVNSNPQGRVEIEMFGDVPVGSRRFHQLAVGTDGVGYRLSKIDGVSKVRVICHGAACLAAIGPAGASAQSLIKCYLRVKAPVYGLGTCTEMQKRSIISQPAYGRILLEAMSQAGLAGFCEEQRGVSPVLQGGR